MNDEMLFDKRIIQRNTKKGLIERKDVEKRIEQLPDRADHCEPIQLMDVREGVRAVDDEPPAPIPAPRLPSFGVNGGSAQIEPATFAPERGNPAQA